MNPTELESYATPLSAHYFDAVQHCLLLAPHPDDESLGCGGLVAMLTEIGKKVSVIFTTDGSMSHPGSALYPAPKLAALRRAEALAALEVLGVQEKDVFFMEKKDGALPARGEEDFEQNSQQLHQLISNLQPNLVLVPYEKDPHRDHRATWQMLMNAQQPENARYKVLEYLIWLFELGEETDMPHPEQVRYLDIKEWQPQKQLAIGKHVSQISTLIDDDPNGFMLSADVLKHFSVDKEYYISREL